MTIALEMEMVQPTKSFHVIDRNGIEKGIRYAREQIKHFQLEENFAK